ncbi:MAG: TolC family protein [Leptospira sp.]|nr:TolC family protein [Leptospira sp.]
MNRWLFLFILIPFTLFGEGLDFTELWKQIEENSSERKAKYLLWKAGEIARDRSDRHFLPRVYTDLRSFQTNDPALNFLGKLGQRSATDSDFSTASTRVRPGNFLDQNNQPHTGLNSDSINLIAKDNLNYPGSNIYSRGTLGVDLPLYEGGSSTAMASMMEKRSAGLKHEWLFIRDREFAQAGFYYRSVQSLREFKNRLETIHKIEARFQSNYSLRNKGNPVGYSGFLALKSLKNQIKVYNNTVDLQITDYLNTLQILSNLTNTDLNFKEIELDPFLEQYFPLNSEYERSQVINAQLKYAEVDKLKSDVEMSKFLPKIGVYSEAYAYQGSRNFANAYQAGVYVQMNLYSPKEIGSVEEAKLNAEASFKLIQEKAKAEELHLTTLKIKERSQRENLDLLRETYRFQEEQVSNIQKLFQSGAASAIQFAEVLNRTLEVSKYLMESEIAYLQTRTEISLYTKKDNSNE